MLPSPELEEPSSGHNLTFYEIDNNYATEPRVRRTFFRAIPHSIKLIIIMLPSPELEEPSSGQSYNQSYD